MLQGYQSRKLVFNAACTEEPAIIVVPNNERDVAVALNAAKKYDLPLRFFMISYNYSS